MSNTDHPTPARPPETGWRAYQNKLQSRNTRHLSRRWILRLIILAAVLAGIYRLTADRQPPSTPSPPPAADNVASGAALITKADVQLLIQQADLPAPLTEEVRLPFENRQFQVKTSLDTDMQAYLLKSMDRKNSRYIGIVVMEGDTGRVLSLAGFNKIQPDSNPCLLSRYPAASIFKIVTAAAAVDHCGYDEHTVMKFNGYKHTLYKSQLKELTNRHTNRLSLKDSFAQSVNPVFGKLGSLYLGKKALEHSAAAFGFNRPIDFELPVETSRIHVEDKPYQWAEIASGFNNNTTISPLHGAMMASAVLNGGRMLAPRLVDQILDDAGRMLYRAQVAWTGRAMSAKASEVLTRMMETTIRTGTGRKAFRGRRRNRILSKLTIGGKTGSIFNRKHDARFDWFVGFAREKGGGPALAIGVLVAHEEYIGIRATQYARMAMTYYFKHQFARHADDHKKSNDS